LCYSERTSRAARQLDRELLMNGIGSVVSLNSSAYGLVHRTVSHWPAIERLAAVLVPMACSICSCCR